MWCTLPCVSTTYSVYENQFRMGDSPKSNSNSWNRQENFIQIQR